MAPETTTNVEMAILEPMPKTMNLRLKCDNGWRCLKTNKVYATQESEEPVGEIRGGDFVATMVAQEEEQETLEEVQEGTVKPSAEPRLVLREHYNAEVMAQLLKAPENVICRKDLAMLKKYHDRKCRDALPVFVNVVYKDRPIFSGVSMGRRYPDGPSLMSFPSQIRSALASGMVEIDQKNAQPTIALFFMKKHGLPYTHMEHYINHREEVLKSISPSRSDAKDAVLKVMFGSKDVPDALTGLAAELARLAKVIHDIGGKDYLWTKEASAMKSLNEGVKYDRLRVPPTKTDVKVRGLAFLLQTEETKISDALAQFCSDNGLEVGLRLHDGVFVSGEVSDDFLRRAEAYITQATGYTMPLDTKPCKCDIDLSALGSTDKADSDYDASKVFIHRLGWRFRIDNNTPWVYSPTNGMWSLVVNFNATVHDLVTEELNKDNTFLAPIGKNTKKISAMSPFVLSNLKLTHSGVLNPDTSIGYIPMKNGLLRMSDGQLIPFDPDIVVIKPSCRTGFTPFDWDSTEDPEAEAHVHRIHFRDPFVHTNTFEAGDYLSQFIACGMAGEYKRQKMGFYLGETSCGKGILSRALMTCFYQADEWKVNSISVSNNTRDDARNLYWVGRLEGIRVAVSNELKGGLRIEETVLKNLTGSGDGMDVREGHGNERKVVCRTTLIACANSEPEIVGADEAVLKRVRYIQGTTSYKDEVVHPHDRLSDPSIEAIYEQDRYRLALVRVILKAYQSLPDVVRSGRDIPMPLCVRSFTKASSGSDRSILDLLGEGGWEVTRNGHDKVPAKEVLDYMMKTHTWSKTRVGKQLRIDLVCSPNGIPTVSESNSVTYYHGLRRLGYVC